MTVRRLLFGDADAENRRLEGVVEELRQGLRDGWRRRTELEVEVESLRDELAQVRADAADTIAHVQMPGPPDAVANQLDELLAIKDALTQELGAVLGDLTHGLARIEEGEPLPHVEPAEPMPAAAFPAPRRRGSLRGADEALLDRTFPAHLELDVGPFDGFVPLAQFEQALVRLPNVEDAYVRRFAGERAVIELTASEPLRLLRMIAEQLPYDVELVDAEDARLALKVVNGG